MRGQFSTRMRKEMAHAFEWDDALTGISTGSFMIDRMLGSVGGFPRGRASEVFGWESSGKTTVCLAACAAAQRAGLYAAYLDVEHGADLTWAQNIGFRWDDPSVGAYLTPRTFEDTLTLLEGLIDQARADIIIVDSVAALVPEAVLSGGLGDKTAIAENARIFSSVLPRLVQKVHGGSTALVFVNQMRKLVNTGWTPSGAPTEQTSGGSALRFYSSLRIEMKQTKRGILKRTVVDPMTKLEEEVVVSSLHSAKAFKNKVSSPYRTASFYIRVDDVLGIYGIDNLQSLIDAAIEHDIIEKHTGGYYTIARPGEEPLRVQGMDTLYRTIRDTPGVGAYIRDAVFAKAVPVAP